MEKHTKSPPTDRPHIIHPDGKGLGLRVTQAGAAAFVFRYRNADRRERMISLGSPPGLKVAEARKKADARRQQVRDGRDPLAERQTRLHAPTIAELAILRA